LERADLPHVAALRRRFDRLIVMSIDPQRRPPVSFPGLRVIAALDADEACTGWNLQALT
ncbi:MAG: hypothetical protein QOI15_2452, partial [Pseudonocardiales bacterium]|nr:hypothetical protein [Pseudonocardiales bacterium]